MGTSPQISILIPNFNNGRESSSDRTVDLIGDLFASLHETLVEDPTPLEILVCDDGSTDDSLETCRTWAGKTWGGWRRDQPFLRLIEREHCGVLSVTANLLTRTSSAEICVRLDGDIVCLTNRWAEKIKATFDQGPPDLGVIGPKQLGIDGRIHSMGDWILHPRGNHHIAQGAARDAVTRAIEVDHVMGCFYCHKRAVFDQLGGYDESMLRGQTIDFGLRARMHGWRCFAVPHVEFTHRHALRAARQTRADTQEGVDHTLDVFESKWGFSRIAPDLDTVQQRYAGTSLLWNARFFGPATAALTPAKEPIEIASSAWARYTQDDAYRKFIDTRCAVAREVFQHISIHNGVLHTFCGEGVLTHLLAKGGTPMIGVDPDRHRVSLAQSVTAREQYTVTPHFKACDMTGDASLDPHTMDAVLLFDVVERHPNPVALFETAHRMLREDGLLVIVTPNRPGPFDRDADALHYYRRHELRLQVKGTRKFAEFGEGSDSSNSDLIIYMARSVQERSRRTSGMKSVDISAPEVVAPLARSCS